MSTVTQLVPNYVLGISEQPDELKLSGQVKDLQNAIPDVTLGCVKRSGSKFVKKITPNTGTLSWFHIYTDNENQYIGNVSTSGVFQIWRTSDGASIPVDYSGVTGTNAATYLTGWTKETDIQALTINENTFLTNRTKTTAMKSGASDKSPALVNEAIIELKTISYGKQYALNIYDPSNPGTSITETRATSIAAKADFSESGGANDGSCEAMGREVINATASNTSNLRYEIDVRCTPVVDPNNIGGSSSGPQYNDSYQPFAKLQFGGEGWVTGNTHSYTTKKGGTGSVEITSHVTMKCSANIAKVRPAATSSSADEAVTASGILGGMKTSLDAVSGTGITATITGNCLHLTRSTPFAVSTPEPQLMTIITNEANAISELPTNCRHNYVVKIVNSGDDDDDYYLKFKQANAGTGNQNYFGEGVWEECPAPNLEIEIDKDTMPVRLVRELPGNVYPNGRFLCESIDWIKRDVGDDNTNPVPSFIGSNIEKLLFFRNRLCALSKGNAILSKTNDFFNFFSTTAMSESTADPIDLQASSTFPTTLFDGIEVNSGLLIFSSNQQFMLTTDSDVFSPTTAKINALSTYNFNFATNPISLGTTIGFLDNAGKFSRFFEMVQVQREGEPQVIEQSAVVSRLFEKDLKLISNSRENSVIFFSEEGTNTLYGYRYFDQVTERKLASWFRWTLTGTIQYHCMQDDNLYVVVRNNSKDQLLKYAIKMDSNTFALAENRVHLDHLMEVSGWSYNATTDKSTKVKPIGLESTNQLAAYDVDAGNNLGRYGLITINGSNLELDGNWSGETFLIGYQYTMEVKLPTIYYVIKEGQNYRSDTRSNTIIHRVKLGFGPLGLYETTLSRIGRTDYTEVFEVSSANQYLANTGPIVDDNILRSVPIYDRNINAALTIKSTHPAPATIHNMTWEGVYTTNNYQRV